MSFRFSFLRARFFRAFVLLFRAALISRVVTGVLLLTRIRWIGTAGAAGIVVVIIIRRIGSRTRILLRLLLLRLQFLLIISTWLSVLFLWLFWDFISWHMRWKVQQNSFHFVQWLREHDWVTDDNTKIISHNFEKKSCSQTKKKKKKKAGAEEEISLWVLLIASLYKMCDVATIFPESWLAKFLLQPQHRTQRRERPIIQSINQMKKGSWKTCYLHRLKLLDLSVIHTRKSVFWISQETLTTELPAPFSQCVKW